MASGKEVKLLISVLFLVCVVQAQDTPSSTNGKSLSESDYRGRALFDFLNLFSGTDDDNNGGNSNGKGRSDGSDEYSSEDSPSGSKGDNGGASNNGGDNGKATGDTGNAETAPAAGEHGTEKAETAPGAGTPGHTGPGFDVMKYGAKADGKSDSTKPFLDAWNAVCAGGGTLTVPAGKYLVGILRFEGPCKGAVTVLIKGTLLAPSDVIDSKKSQSWITFWQVPNIQVDGAGTGVVDGQGAASWEGSGCKNAMNCKSMLYNIHFLECDGGSIKNLKIMNSKYFHLSVNNLNGFHASNLKIEAPADSPNTNGFHMGSVSNVVIDNCEARVGDDCFDMVQGSTDITITNSHCGPGHGISIGSLGKEANEKDVSNIYIKNCTFEESENGIRIKSWGDSSPMKAFNMTFEDITMKDVQFPIIIDQNYCPKHDCPAAASKVALSDITYKNFKGTSATKLAVNILCSKGVPCQNVKLIDIDLAYGPGGEVAALCQNAKIVPSGKANPSCTA